MVVVLAVVVADVVRLRGPGRVDNTILQACSQVCFNKGIDNATPYTNASGIHPIALLGFNGQRHEWTDLLPKEWWPKNVSEVQLVIAVDLQLENIVQVCPYTSPDGTGIQYVTRIQYSVRVILRDAKTAHTVGSKTLFGSSPPECMPAEPADLTRLEGSHVTVDQLIEWLRPYVVLGS